MYRPRSVATTATFPLTYVVPSLSLCWHGICLAFLLTILAWVYVKFGIRNATIQYSQLHGQRLVLLSKQDALLSEKERITSPHVLKRIVEKHAGFRLPKRKDIVHIKRSSLKSL
ncbi:MAG: hypothetical protein VYC40_02895 [Pseudomonadota bacterium]|nr:hypothetical protein [Pseudomonadota bacterium]